MVMENDSPVRFQLEEQVLLPEHVTERDLISLDLKPQVDVTAEDHLVTIKGELILSGHFNTSDTEVDSERGPLVEQLQFSSPEVEEQDEDDGTELWSLAERFPIDITVPANKVERLEDVYVTVDQLDYSFNESGHLRIEASIALFGVENGMKVDRQALGFEPWVNEEAALDVDDYIASEPSDNVEEEEPIEAPLVHFNDYLDEADEQIDRGDESDNGSEIESVENDEEQERAKDDLEEERAQDDLEDEMAQDDQEESAEGDQEIVNDEEIAQDERALEEDHEDEDEEAETDQAALQKVAGFFSKLMAGKEDETPQRRTLKICIVQHNESLEQIAQRYDVTPEEIIRFNRLPSSDVAAGDLMYIPIKPSK